MRPARNIRVGGARVPSPTIPHGEVRRPRVWRVGDGVGGHGETGLDGSSRSRDWWQSNRKEVHQKHSITPPFFTLTNSAERVIQYWYDILVFIGTFVLWIEFRLSVRCLPLWINFFLHACRISYPSLGLACLPHCRTPGQGATQISGESCTRCHNVRPTRSKERIFPKCLNYDPS